MLFSQFCWRFVRPALGKARVTLRLNQTRLKTYWNRRMPIKVIRGGDENEIDERYQQKELKNPARKLRQSFYQEIDTGSYPVGPEFVTSDAGYSDLPKFKKLTEKNHEFTKALVSVRTRNRREKFERILLEGKRLIFDAMTAGLKPEQIFFSKPELLASIPRHLLDEEYTKIYKTFYKQMQLWSDLTTCPGIMGIFKKPDYAKSSSFSTIDAVPITLICDNIREPGNIGAILRVAAAANVKQVIVTKGSVDVWNPKVLRGACGAHFRVPIFGPMGWDYAVSHMPADVAVFLADNKMADLESYTGFRPIKKVILRTEANEDTEERDENSEDSDSNEDAEELENSYELDDSGFRRDPSYVNRQELQKYGAAHIDSLPYDQVNFCSRSNDVCLVVGGETEGLSEGALKFASDNDGLKVIVPVGNGVDSLNSAVATGIITYEIRRQILEARNRSRDVV